MRATGRVKWFDANRGFGFIIPEAGGKDVFVHWSAIRADGFRLLIKGELVEFELVHADPTYQAIEVVRLEPHSEPKAPPVEVVIPLTLEKEPAEHGKRRDRRNHQKKGEREDRWR